MDGLDLADRPVFCIYPDLRRVDGNLEKFSPGGAPRRGVFGLDTTRGDRLFISLLGSVFIFLGWLWFFSTPLYGALVLSIIWSVFVFWRV